MNRTASVISALLLIASTLLPSACTSISEEEVVAGIVFPADTCGVLCEIPITCSCIEMQAEDCGGYENEEAENVKKGVEVENSEVENSEVENEGIGNAKNGLEVEILKNVQTRSVYIKDPLYENVLQSLFFVQFNSDGNLIAYSKSVETISGSQTMLYDKTLTLRTNTYSTTYLLVNFSEENRSQLIPSNGKLTLSKFKESLISLNNLAEQSETNESSKRNGRAENNGNAESNGSAENNGSTRSSDQEILSISTSYLPMIGSYTGTITSNATPVNFLLGRYVARVTLNIVTESDDDTFTDVKVCIKNAPKQLPIIPASTADEYMELITDLSDVNCNVFKPSEMTDATPISTVNSTSTTASATRYFYIGENLSNDSEKQIQIQLEATHNGRTIQGSVPLSTSGRVTKNTNYEIILRLKDTGK